MRSAYLVGYTLVVAAGSAIGADAVAADLVVSESVEAMRQASPVAQREIEVSMNSDIVVASATQIASYRGVERPQQVVAWSEVIDIPDAGWVRLRFGETHLAPATDETRESYLRVTSLSDGHEQYLDREALRKWRGTSAYFNGGAVLIELMVSPTANAGVNEVSVSSVMASEPTQFDRSLCGVDDRALSSDPREARIMPIGCTGWLFGDQGNSMLTAGHCNMGNGGDVIQFNVPLSTSGGTPVSPPPQDQYPVDLSSIQDTPSPSLGNDWAFFGVYDNTDTGLTPLAAQGESFELATSLPPLDARTIRITGYGSTTSPVPASWYLVQKTHTGPLFNYNGNVVQYTVDTTGGNSGGSVFDEVNQNVIAIHTNAGCDSVGGNQGCSLFNAGLQAALADPQGITQPRGLNIGVQTFFPNPLDPSGGQEISVVVAADNGLTPSGVVTMYTDTGSGYFANPMSSVGAGIYTGAFPAADCPSDMDFYFEALDTDGGAWTFPAGGASDPISAIVADGQDIVISDTFEIASGWTVENTALSTGAWTRTVPGDFDRNDPPAAYGGSGNCFVTGAGTNEDVDGGPTRLISPMYDLDGVGSPIVEFARWYVSDSPNESLVVEFSDNGGGSWVQVDAFPGGSSEWDVVSYAVEDHVSATDQFMVRFTCTDNPNDSVTEGAIDSFAITSTICGSDCAPDLSVPFGVLDIFDVNEFIVRYNTLDMSADFSEDGVIDIFDAFAFIESFLAGCP